MSRGRLVALLLAFLLLGALGGWLVRRFLNPTLEERAHDAAKDVRGAVEKLTR